MKLSDLVGNTITKIDCDGDTLNLTTNTGVHIRVSADRLYVELVEKIERVVIEEKKTKLS